MAKAKHDGPIRGVNLGGWLVLEKWMTPSLFKGTEATDEYTFCESADKAGIRRLRSFRGSFITERDITWLADHGVQAVRLPVGYWLFGDEPPFDGTVKYVDKLFGWAAKYRLKVLLDLHGAPGSQNGWDHSGQAGKVGWPKQYTNTVKTLSIIKRIAERYGKHPQLLGIEMLNEPKRTVPKRVLKHYYISAYKIIRQLCGPHVWVVMHDNFRPHRWRRVLRGKKFENVYIDTHHYHCFSKRDKRHGVNWHIGRLLHHVPKRFRRMMRYHPLIIGEWSLALDKNTVGEVSAAEGEALNRSFAGAQLMAFSGARAWFFWTYQLEHGTVWSYRRCVEQGLLPGRK
jgi:glucan 1,3-beta-glucosidase